MKHDQAKAALAAEGAVNVAALFAAPDSGTGGGASTALHRGTAPQANQPRPQNG